MPILTWPAACAVTLLMIPTWRLNVTTTWQYPLLYNGSKAAAAGSSCCQAIVCHCPPHQTHDPFRRECYCQICWNAAKQYCDKFPWTRVVQPQRGRGLLQLTGLATWYPQQKMVSRWAVDSINDIGLGSFSGETPQQCTQLHCYITILCSCTIMLL